MGEYRLVWPQSGPSRETGMGKGEAEEEETVDVEDGRGLGRRRCGCKYLVQHLGDSEGERGCCADSIWAGLIPGVGIAIVGVVESEPAA